MEDDSWKAARSLFHLVSSQVSLLFAAQDFQISEFAGRLVRRVSLVQSPEGAEGSRAV